MRSNAFVSQTYFQGFREESGGPLTDRQIYNSIPAGRQGTIPGADRSVIKETSCEPHDEARGEQYINPVVEILYCCHACMRSMTDAKGLSPFAQFLTGLSPGRFAVSPFQRINWQSHGSRRTSDTQCP